MKIQNFNKKKSIYKLNTSYNCDKQLHVLQNTLLGYYESKEQSYLIITKFDNLKLEDLKSKDQTKSFFVHQHGQ